MSESVSLRIDSINVQPIAIDAQFALRSFLGTRLPPEATLFGRHCLQGLPLNPLATGNQPKILAPPYPPLPPIRIGELQWPSGISRYARALYAVDWITLQAIAQHSWGYELPVVDPEAETPVTMLPTDTPENWGATFEPITLELRGMETFTAQMYPLAPYRVPGAGIDLWLLPLVDKRWLLNKIVFEPMSEGPTFAELVTELETSLDISLGGVVIPTEFIKPDERSWKFHHPAALILDHLLLSTGFRVVYDGSTDVFQALSAADSTTRRQTTLDKPWITAGGRSGVAVRPESVTVWTRTPDGSHQDQAGAVPDGGAYPLHVWSTWLNNDNTVATTAFADKIAEIVGDWSDSGGQYAFAGPINYRPSGYDDYASIELYETAPDEYYFGTRIHELPNVFLPDVIVVNGVVEDVGGGAFFLTPSGGIAAATGTEPNLTVGVATCQRVEYWLDGSTVKTRLRSPTLSEPVHNSVKAAVSPNKVVHAKKINGRWTVDVEDCN